MAMQTGPGAPLVVPQAQLLLAILMEAFDGPAAMAELELAGQGSVVQMPGEVPLGLVGLAGQGAFAQEPAQGTGDVVVGPVDAQAAGLALGRAGHHDRAP